MTQFNWIDYLFIIIFFISILRGIFRGFVKEIVSLITVIAAFVIAILFTQPLANAFTDTTTVQHAVNHASSVVNASVAEPTSYLALSVSFAVLFIGTLLIGSLINFILNMAFQTGILGAGNRILGGIFGFVRGFIVILVIIFVVQLTALGSEPKWHQSKLVYLYQPAVQWLGNIVFPNLGNWKTKVGQTIQNVNSQIQNISTPK